MGSRKWKKQSILSLERWGSVLSVAEHLVKLSDRGGGVDYVWQLISRKYWGVFFFFLKKRQGYKLKWKEIESRNSIPC